MDGFDETYPRKRTAVSKRKKQNSKPDWLVSLSSAQLALAVAGVLLLLLISKASPAGFNELRSKFNTIMQTDMSVSQVADAVKSLIPEKITGQNESVSEESAASGGEDIELYEATENVCFAPIETTVDICIPVEGEITSRFGYRTHPITGKFGIHNGTDIAAEEGTKISAALNGVVEEVGYNDVRGNYILLSHGGDTKTLYMHCSEIIAPEGAVIRQGEIIALVGNTGWSTGPHLHFSIIIGGKYCNPEWLINDI